MAKKETRDYKGSDAAMLEAGETMHASFVDDTTDFAAYDTTLNAVFAANWLAAINAARGTDNDNTVVSQQKDNTTLVAEAMQLGRDAYTDVIYFAEKAFKNKPDRVAEFGKGLPYRKARNNQPRMLEFLEELATVTNRYSADLTTAGAPAAILGRPQAAFANLGALNITQNRSIKGRPQITQDRIVLLNTAYGFMTLVEAAALRVYRNNITKQGVYTYSPIINTDNDDLFEGSLAPSENRVVVEGGRITSATNLITIENPGNTTLRIGVLPGPGTPPADAVELAPGTSISFAGNTLSNLPQYLLIIQNLSATETGEYRVEIED